jgi:DNA helicase-2/ATP-dependent DNA helicase PcrA
MFSESLNAEQLQAVKHVDGPLMVMAGAGSGKTRVITCRIASLIQESNVRPESILAITFTNKAAKEMKSRIRTMLADVEGAPWVSTFHSFCLRVLRQHIDQLDYPKDFVIYDAQDQLSLVKQSMKTARVNHEAFAPKSILGHISSFKNEFLFPEDIDKGSLSFGLKLKAAEVYSVYQEGLKNNKALDFDDLLIWTVRLLKEVPSVAEYYHGRYRYLLVDEFQDTNVVQYQLVKLLSAKNNNVCVVGDDDQSIYRWRGAILDNILNFDKDFPGTVVIKLEKNYRSTQNILKAASAVVQENTNRNPKTLWTENEAGEPIVYYRAEDEVQEARKIGDRVQKLYQEKGVLFNQMAVLYRTNAQSRVVEDTMRDLGIPHQVLGGQRFYQRKEIKDILAFMKVSINPEESVSLKRIINVPPRGIGKTSLEKVEEYCARENLPLIDGLRHVGEIRSVSTGAVRKIRDFVRLLENLDEFRQNNEMADLVTEVVEQTGYGAMLQKDISIESKSRVENIKELYSAMEQFAEKNEGTLQDFLDSTALVADVDSLQDERGVLPIMTLHTCKGLEFDCVFIVGMEDGLLPHASSMSDPAEYEEERRLCYVGFTRARKQLFLSNARSRRVFGNVYNYPPSEFLLSIPQDILQKEEGQAARFQSSGGMRSYAVSTPTPKEIQVGSGGGDYAVGKKVLHAKFGAGVIINQTGNEDDLRVEIFFKKPYGKKKLAVNHANLITL